METGKELITPLLESPSELAEQKVATQPVKQLSRKISTKRQPINGAKPQQEKLNL